MTKAKNNYLIFAAIFLVLPVADEKENLKKSLSEFFTKISNSDLILDNLISKDEKKVEDALHSVFGFKEKQPLAIVRKDKETILKYIIPSVMKFKNDEIKQFVAVNIVTHDAHIREEFRMLIKTMLNDQDEKTRLGAISCLEMLIPEKRGNTIKKLEDSIKALLMEKKSKEIKLAGIHICTQLQLDVKIQMRNLIYDQDPQVSSQAMISSLILGNFDVLQDIQKQYMNSKEPLVKGTAMSILADLDPKNMKDAVTKALKENDKNLKFAAISVCVRQKINTTEIKKEVEKLLKDKDENTRKFAFSMIVPLKLTSANDETLAAIKGKDKDLKIMAIGIAAEMRFNNCLTEIKKLLNDKDNDVRHAALAAARELKFKDKDFKDKIIKLISDKNTDKELVFGIILNLDLRECKSKLIELLAQKEPDFDPLLLIPLFSKFGVTFNDLKPHIKEPATIEIIGALGMETAKEDLMKILRGKDDKLKPLVISTLVRLGIKDAKPEILDGLLSSNESLRNESLGACVVFEFTEVKDSLSKFLDDPSPMVQITAIRACMAFDIKDKKLLKLLNDEECPVKHAAITAVGKFKMKDAEPVLLKFIRDEDYPIYVEALISLLKLNNKSVKATLADLLKHDYRPVILIELNGSRNEKLFKTLEEMEIKDEEKTIDDLAKFFKDKGIKITSELPKEINEKHKIKFGKCNAIELFAIIAEQLGCSFVLENNEVVLTATPKAIEKLRY